MWILRGSLLGVVIFFVIFAIRFHRIFYHNLIDPKIVSQITVHSWLFWVGLAGCVMVGCVLVGYWSPAAK